MGAAFWLGPMLAACAGAGQATKPPAQHAPAAPAGPCSARVTVAPVASGLDAELASALAGELTRRGLRVGPDAHAATDLDLRVVLDLRRATPEVEGITTLTAVSGDVTVDGFITQLIVAPRGDFARLVASQLADAWTRSPRIKDFTDHRCGATGAPQGGDGTVIPEAVEQWRPPIDP
jgi:hypothetical protein